MSNFDPTCTTEFDADWSFLGDDSDRERMCRSLDFETISKSSNSFDGSMTSMCADWSEPSLTKTVNPGLFGSQRAKTLAERTKMKESFKNKILSVWTNTKNGFMTKISQDFKNTPEIWMLGKCYDDVSTFKNDFSLLPWITYRRGFPELGPQKMTSDVGWGCMIRCAQMCLALTLNCHFKSTNGACKVASREALKLFGDHPGRDFSIHSLVSSGERKGRLAGSWFGPASISFALKEVLTQTKNKLLQDLAIYVAQDSTVFIRDALEEMKGQRSLMIIIPLRLGYSHVNEIYTEAFERVFRWKSCTGVMGGRPKHSVFFVGCQDNDLIYLDPHFNQDVVDLAYDSCIETYSCTTPMKMNFAKIDPTCAVSFYCRDQSELWDLITLVKQTEDELKKPTPPNETPGTSKSTASSSSSQKQAPILHFVDAKYNDMLVPEQSMSSEIEIDLEYSICDAVEGRDAESTCTRPKEKNQNVDGRTSSSGEKSRFRSYLVPAAGRESSRQDVDVTATTRGDVIDDTDRQTFRQSRFPRNNRYFEHFGQALMMRLNPVINHFNQPPTGSNPASSNPSCGSQDEQVESCVDYDYSYLSSLAGSSHCKPRGGRVSVSHRSTDWRDEASLSKEEDGFVVL